MIRYYCSGYDIRDPFGNGLGDMIKNELSNINSVVYVVGSPKKPNCSVQILEELSHDRWYVIRENIVKNPNCPVHILEELSKESA